MGSGDNKSLSREKYVTQGFKKGYMEHGLDLHAVWKSKLKSRRIDLLMPDITDIFLRFYNQRKWDSI